MMGTMAKSYSATFLKRGPWWLAWSEDVPGALTQGRTLAEAKANLRDAIRLMLQPADLGKLPKARIVQDRVRV
jgi:predicted RNase H-like HicB family nuclease